MATIRRLSDDDVRAIFESLHGNQPPPNHLNFKIVPVGPNGLKLSPPSYEFEDGLYVLLKPERKRKSGNLSSHQHGSGPRVPHHLAHLLTQEVHEEVCPWSLSGPQFPSPTAIQQRYCYPKGSPEYSSRKGGALWTMYGVDGKEDLEYRLLHVYFSAKRAVNKGLTPSEVEREQFKRQRDDGSIASPVRSIGSYSSAKKRRVASDRARRSPWQDPAHHRSNAHRVLSPYPVSATSSSTRSPGISLQMTAVLPPPSPCTVQKQSRRRQPPSSQEKQTPRSSHLFRGSPNGTVISGTTQREIGHTYSNEDDDGNIFGGYPFYPINSFDASLGMSETVFHDEGPISAQTASTSTEGLSHPYLLGSNSRQVALEDVFRRNTAGNSSASNSLRDARTEAPKLSNSFFDEDPNEFLNSMLDHTLKNDPILNAIMMNPSMEMQHLPPFVVKQQQQQNHLPAGGGGSAKALALRLESLHKNIHESILSRPPSERGALVSVVANWARCLARSPLEPLTRGRKEQVMDEQSQDVDRDEGSSSSAATENSETIPTAAV